MHKTSLDSCDFGLDSCDRRSRQAKGINGYPLDSSDHTNRESIILPNSLVTRIQVDAAPGTSQPALTLLLVVAGVEPWAPFTD